MIEVQTEGNHVSIDVRDLISRGQHPRNEILNVVQEASANTVFEIHVPHYTKPLVENLESMGLRVVVKQLEPRHFVLLTVKY
ncbi:amino acid decarboxylase [Alicyclobacillus tolerans]|uniref:amino acid decarboxylase n=1 Tax=Alicyclobacillus tolerans TaxID=90970 RepID=UPI001F1D0322|nr:amino acid decarboxylase [Alicyclobacillus tolerans]MCF8564340.1 amino acid decarboxylase [Alicyclobacillus tolerans]